MRKAVPEPDGVWEEGSLIALSSFNGYQVMKSMSSDSADWREMNSGDFNLAIYDSVNHGHLQPSPAFLD